MKRRRRTGERGVALALIAIALTTIFAMIVIAVDVGRFAHTATEVQSVADHAALAGAKTVLVKGAGNAQAGANTTALQNTFDGRTFVNDGTIASLPVDEGCYARPAAGCTTNCTGTFTVQAPPCPAGQLQAVRATATGQAVRIITAALLPINAGLQSLNITKQAIAAIEGFSAGGPALPVTICPNLLSQQSGPCVQGTPLGAAIALVPDPSQNACYTSLDGSSANAQTFISRLPSSCGGSSSGPTIVSLGESINLQNGADTSFLQALQNCVAQGVHDYTLPVMQNCGNCNGSGTVVDFVTIHIANSTDVVATGPAANKGIHNATQICNNNVPSGGGSGSAGLYGSRGVNLVQ